ncbi:MAG: transcription factor S, partial [Candidatus Hadarchaeales archaeon]
MQFCPKCGSLMLPKKEGERSVLVCSSCGHSEEKKDLESYRVVKRERTEDDVLIIDEVEKPPLPTTRARCPSCGHDTAYWWMRQTRAADEPSTRFYKCA